MTTLDLEEIVALRASGAPLKAIAERCGVIIGTIHAAFSKNPPGRAAVSA